MFAGKCGKTTGEVIVAVLTWWDLCIFASFLLILVLQRARSIGQLSFMPLATWITVTICLSLSLVSAQPML